jgi:hypothetical protein
MYETGDGERDEDQTAIGRFSDLPISTRHDRAHLIVLAGESLGQMFRVDQAEIVIGRASDAAIRLPPSGTGRPCPCSCSTWMTSSWSTTAMGTSRGTMCWRPSLKSSAPRSEPKTSSHAMGAKSSPSCVGAPQSRTRSLSFTSELDASMATVWEVVGTMKGVNAELGPWLSMTAPPEASNLRIEDAPVGQPLFASWVLLGRVLPIDRHSCMLAQVEPGRGFVEDSTSWSQRRWEHRRHLDARGEDGCTLTDRLTFTPRLSMSGPILVRVIGAIFRHRHRLLRERFGGRAQ